MNANPARDESWPALPLESWRDTRDTLHMWTQMVGKLALATTPLINHWWNVTLHLTARGLATQPMNSRGRKLTATFDFISHELIFQCSDGLSASIAMKSRTVADFYAEVMATLRRMEVDAHIWTMPSEVPDPIRFETDTTHRSYDPAWAHAHWRALVSMWPTLEEFRSRFIGKCSPVHFFWGGFDVAVTRFSGRRAPPRPEADAVTREGYSHEVISQGFWPGGKGFEDAAFYAYAAPEPEGFRAARIQPAAARYVPDLGIFLLPYEAVRTSASPERELQMFLESTYGEAARLASWDRRALER
jgi:hypothetical protein